METIEVETVNLQCAIPVDLMRRLRIAAAERKPKGTTVRAIVIEAVEKQLTKEEAKRP